ncbi:hypothetical protein [Mycolicibacterium fortuitum]|uniref:hypothetical protein n=1 Tax=Mycolicibacterium fortuitum TaxID=1766 RepID=UPI001CE1B785|nr:hypothetical protein [Mycolicibacterium fortuitum]
MSAMGAMDLLGQAQRVLRAPGSAEGLSSRVAAFLARQALETIIDQRCSALKADAPWANSRSKLVVLKSLDTAEAADRAALAWNRLSVACHVHAFEMQPSTAEVEYLCGVVASLIPAEST